MKALALLFLALPIVGFAQSPRFQPSTPRIQPETTYRVIFEKAVVAPERVGETVGVRDSFLEVAPAWEGRVRWIDPGVAEFLPDEAPIFGNEYVFSVRSGLAHADGSPVTEGEVLRVGTEPLEVAWLSRPWSLRGP